MQIVVVSPFLDRRHGTELCVIEQIQRLSSVYGWGIRLFSQRVDDVNALLTEEPEDPTRGFIRWYKISDIPGPHVLKFLWWFFANQISRRRTLKRVTNQPALVYSPGINCLDANAISVHIVFHELYERISSDLALRRVPVNKWPIVIHRKLYYRLIMALEWHIYRNTKVRLAAVSKHVSNQLEKHFGRADATVISNAVDTARFNSEARVVRRSASRQTMHLKDHEFGLLLIGNDWKTKGLDCLLQACAMLSDIPLKLLVVGRDDPGLYRPALRDLGIEDRVQFLTPLADVVSFYAAADAYIAPSLEDAFGLPIIEAMACGLPVIASVRAGASDNILDGKTGYLLNDPTNYGEIARLIRQLADDRPTADRVGLAAAKHVLDSLSWDDNAAATRLFLEDSVGVEGKAVFAAQADAKL